MKQCQSLLAKRKKAAELEHLLVQINQRISEFKVMSAEGETRAELLESRYYTYRASQHCSIYIPTAVI